MRPLRYPHDRITVDPDTGCWNWSGSTNKDGYPRMHRGYAHRILYEHHVGPIPAGFTIDHRCENTHCVNPAHFEAVTQRTNILRGNGPAARNARKTHCIHGHEFTPENTHTRVSHGRTWRDCRTCARTRAACHAAVPLCHGSGASERH